MAAIVQSTEAMDKQEDDARRARDASSSMPRLQPQQQISSNTPQGGMAEIGAASTLQQLLHQQRQCVKLTVTHVDTTCCFTIGICETARFNSWHVYIIQVEHAC